MAASILVLILTSVSLSALAQITLKYGMSSPRVVAGLGGASRSEAVWAIATSPAVIGGLAMYGVGALVWLLVLARTDVSKAYPFVGLGFLLTMAFGSLFLGEAVSLQRVLGTLFVAAGVYLVATS